MRAMMRANARTMVEPRAPTPTRRRRAGRRGPTTRAAKDAKPWGDSTQCVQNGASREGARARWKTRGARGKRKKNAMRRWDARRKTRED
jgi:hypothetical protein